MQDLAEALDVLSRSIYGHILVEMPDSPYYLQIASDTGYLHTDRVLLDAVANRYLYDGWQLSRRQEAELVAAGWTPPSDPCRHGDPCVEVHGNWTRDDRLGLDEPADQRVVLGVVLAALGIYGAVEGTEIEVSYACSAGEKGHPYCD